MTARPKEQDKQIMVLSFRVGIPVAGFNSQGHTRVAHEYVKALRELGYEHHRATTVLDGIEFA